MSSPRVLIDDHAPRRQSFGSAEHAWRAVGRFAWVLVAAGLGDTALAFVPAQFGSPEWEFGTIASTFSALPLITMGFAGLLSSVLARGRHRTARLYSWLLILAALGIFALSLLFLSDAPLALRQVQGEVRIGVQKAIVKTAWLGLVFGLTYLVSGIAALRHIRGAGKA